MKIKGNVGMACLNPSERLDMNKNTKIGMEFNPNQKVYWAGDYIGIGTPSTPYELKVFQSI